MAKTVPSKMAKAANPKELKAAFEKHRDETETHVERLTQVFEMQERRLGEKPATPFSKS